MPRLRDAHIPIGRQLFSFMLKCANSVIILFGVLTVLMSLEINPTPAFSPGWLLIFLGGGTMVAGLTGFGGTTLPCCYISHIILLTISSFGIGVFCLVIFGQRAKVVASFKSTRFPEATVKYLHTVMFLTCVSMLYFKVRKLSKILHLHNGGPLFVADLLGIFVQLHFRGRVIFQRLPVEQFESVEQTRDQRNISLGKMRRELGEQSERVDKTQAGKIGDKMKDKYAKWSHESWGDPN